MLTMPSPMLRKRLYIVERSGDSKTRVTVKLLSRQSYRHPQTSPFPPPTPKTDRYPTCGGESGCRATWSECGRHWHREKTTADGAVSAAVV